MSDLSDLPSEGPPAAPGAGGLDVLELQAASLEQGAAAPGQAQAEQLAGDAIASASADLLAALTMLRMMVAPGMGWWDQFGQVWGDGTLKGIADAGAAVMHRHGWTTGELLQQWGPYIALVGATLPPSLVTYQAVKLRRVEAARPKPAPEPATAP